MTDEMSAKDRDALIRFARAQARQAEREVDTRVAICHAEVADQMTAAFATEDAIWKEAVLMAQEEAEKASTRKTGCRSRRPAPIRGPTPPSRPTSIS
jgi:hypothetical protein